jgi:CHAT domain-containing protein
MSNLLLFFIAVITLILSSSNASVAHQQESPQDSLILLRVENHIKNAEYFAARSFIIKILNNPEKDSAIHQTLEFDLMSKYIEASVYTKTLDFDSLFTIPAILKETTPKFSYLNLLAFHSLIPLLDGNIQSFDLRYEHFLKKSMALYDWRKINKKQEKFFYFQDALENITEVLEQNNYMNEIEIILRQYGVIVGREIDKDNWGYAFNIMGLATYLNNIGLVKQAISLNNEALSYSTQPDVLKNDSGIPYTAYNNLTANYMALNNYSEASRNADSALKCIMRGGNYTEYIRLLLKFIHIYNTLGKYEKVEWAKKFSDSVVVIFAVIIDKYEDREYANKIIKGLPYLIARSNYNYANYLCNINKLDSASYYYKEVLKVFHQDKSHDLLLREKNTYLKLAWLHYTKGDTATAEKYFNLALADDKELLKNVFSVLSDYQKEMFFPLLHSDYDQYNNYLVSTIGKNDSTIIKLINTRLDIKGILMTSATQIKHNSRLVNNSDYLELKKSIITINDDLSRVYLKSLRNKKDNQRSIDSLENLSLEFEKLLTVLKNKHINSKLSFTSDWELVKRALKPNEAAIEIIKIPRYGFYPNIYNPKVKNFYANDSGYYCAVIIKSNSVAPEYVVYNNSSSIDSIYDRYYRKAIYVTQKDLIDKDISRLLKESKDNLKKSYRYLWKDIDSKLNGINKIFISNDGVFDKINLNILIDEKGSYTIDKYDIEIVTSLNRLLTPSPNRASSQITASLFGNPDFDNVPSEIVYDNSSIENLSVITLRGDNQLHTNWKQLPQTNSEIEAISRTLGKNNCRVNTFTKELATEKNVKNITSPTILHIATHGYFIKNTKNSESKHAIDNANSNPMMNSGLILAGANRDNENNESVQDGILTASEAARLELGNTELVVLSACETGLGEVKNGEGVYGLQRAFLLAGANNLIMSLWKVDDLATKELMVIFYKNYMQTKNVTLSLKMAQQTLRTCKKFEHPMFWGGFIVVR